MSCYISHSSHCVRLQIAVQCFAALHTMLCAVGPVNVLCNVTQYSYLLVTICRATSQVYSSWYMTAQLLSLHRQALSIFWAGVEACGNWQAGRRRSRARCLSQLSRALLGVEGTTGVLIGPISSNIAINTHSALQDGLWTLLQRSVAMPFCLTRMPFFGPTYMFLLTQVMLGLRTAISMSTEA